MGGCCCCSYRLTERTRDPTYYYCRRISEEHQPLSGRHASSPPPLLGNLDMSTPDTYTPPPVPLPYNADFGCPQTQGSADICVDKRTVAVQTNNPESEASTECEKVKGTGPEVQVEVELSKPVEPFIPSLEEEDTCPTCLEEYDEDNPKILTKCGHHFHLACILEWLERSYTCAICDKEMVFEHVDE